MHKLDEINTRKHQNAKCIAFELLAAINAVSDEKLEEDTHM